MLKIPFFSIKFLPFLCLSMFFLQCAENDVSKAIANSASDTQEKPAEPEKQSIVFFGTSLTAGYGLSEEEAYPNLIEEKIEEAGLNYKVVNAGLSGETTAAGLRRIEWILQQNVDVFVLELGANDALRGQPVEAAAENLQKIIDAVKAKNSDVKLVVVGMMAPPNLGTTYTNAFKNIYPKLAEKNNATLVPFLLDGVAGNADLNQSDGIHPTAEGQKILAENVWKVLQGVL